MRPEETMREPFELLGTILLGVSWVLCFLLHGVEMYSHGTGSRWPFVFVGSGDEGLVLLSLTALSILNAFLIGGRADSWTPHREPVAWLPPLRSALAGIPFLGLYVLPAWRWLAITEPAWAFVSADRRQVDRGLAPALPLSRGWFLRSSHLFLFSIVAVNALGVQLFLAWSLAPDWPEGNRLPVQVMAEGLLRISGLLATLIPNLFLFRHGWISRRAFPWALLCCLAWLAPWPLYGFAMLSGFWGAGKKQKRLFTTIVYAGRSSAPAFERGRGLDWWRISRWDSWRFSRRAVVTSRPALTALYRAKTFLLILDAAALMLAFGWLAQRWPRANEGASLIMRWATRVSPPSESVLLLLPFILLLLSRGVDLLDRPQLSDLLLPWRYLFLTMAAVLLGLQQGALLLGGQEILLAESLLCAGFVASLSAWTVAMPLYLKSRSRHAPLSIDMLWIALLLSMSLAGELILVEDGMAPGILRVLEICAWLSPVWALGAGLAWGRTLIDPLRWRDLLARRLPARARALALFLLSTSILPFGGLATPLWRFLRRRLAEIESLDHAGKR